MLDKIMGMMRVLLVMGLLMGCALVHGAEELIRKEWTVDGVKREALVHVPAQKAGTQAPVVFGWHGHGGTMRHASRSFAIHEAWPEALVIYPQGLDTPGKLTDHEGKKPGWQVGEGDQGDRDLKFFDAMLASVNKDYAVDAKRIFSMGHSNGGAFTYLLWAERGDVFAAMAPSGAAAPFMLRKLKPKPMLHVAGENDPLVRYQWQRATIDAVLRINKCESKRAWELNENCTYHESAIGMPVVTAIHPGGHEFPSEAPEVMVKFFKSVTAWK